MTKQMAYRLSDASEYWCDRPQVRYGERWPKELSLLAVYIANS